MLQGLFEHRKSAPSSSHLAFELNRYILSVFNWIVLSCRKLDMPKGKQSISPSHLPNTLNLHFALIFPILINNKTI